jgi:hypothetical protein
MFVKCGKIEMKRMIEPLNPSDERLRSEYPFMAVSGPSDPVAVQKAIGKIEFASYVTRGRRDRRVRVFLFRTEDDRRKALEKLWNLSIDVEEENI